MPPLTKSSVAFKGLVTSFADLVHGEWRPPVLPTELKYRDHLIQFLRDNVPVESRVEREYRHGGTTADIYVQWRGILSNDELYIEIKRELKQKPAHDRLIGQLEALNPKERKIMLVFIGDCDEGLVGRIYERYERDIVSGGNMVIVEITPKKPRARKSAQ